MVLLGSSRENKGAGFTNTSNYLVDMARGNRTRVNQGIKSLNY